MGAPDEEAMRRPSNGEERIFVSVRLRPMNDKEIARSDVSDWECINDTTVLYRNSLSVSERSMYPSTYSFDRVFGPDSSTRQVYEDGAKEVAISVVRGINSSVFAYGQTSSGKTYTMTGITEYAVADIYDYIERHEDREFLLKFSAMEIYNESVRDLLSADTTPLRLLDDPERGTVVEKLTEETIVDHNHLKELLSICEAQRQIGETNLNEASSRSHQILRLTIESSAREFFGNDKSSILASSVNFVDLAGSERASQSSSAGMRLKEGCHINRSLLTLGTVIRKLSKGKSGHVPFRDSKLTRILQLSLGGNARTAIICTMSPARIHVEQSRNTLLFASCAKEVTTNAKVNVVVSDKALVKQLQRELSRMENELKTVGLSSGTLESMELIKEKDLQIEKLMKEVAELTRERDEAKSLVENLLQAAENNIPLNTWEDPDQYPKLRVRSSWRSENSYSAVSEDCHSLHIGVRSLDASQCSDGRTSTSSEENFVSLEDFAEKFNQTSSSPHFTTASQLTTGSAHFLGNGDLPKESEEGTVDNFDQFCKEVQCIEVEESSTKSYANSSTLESHLDEYQGRNSLVSAANRSTYTEELESTPDRYLTPKLDSSVDTSAYSEVLNSTPFRYTDLNTSSHNINTGSLGLTNVGNDWIPHPEPVPTESKEEKHVGNSSSDLILPYFRKPFPYLLDEDSLSSRSIKINKSRSCRASIMSNFPAYSSDRLESDDNTAPFKLDKAFSKMGVGYQVKESVLDYGVDSESLPKSSPTLVDDVVKDIEVKSSEDKTDIHVNNVSEPDEGSICTPDHLLQGENPKDTTPRNVKDVGLDPIQDDAAIVPQWPSESKRLQKEIIELWQYCNVSLVHRSYFFQLFEGDSSDSFYMEVEHRRLVYLKDAFLRGLKTMVDGHAYTPASSKRDLDKERQMLSRQMSKRFTTEERENLFLKWDIALNGNQRRLQLAHLIWSKTDTDHITESAALVAKLIGFEEQQEALGDMFGLLNFKPSGRKSPIWKRKDTLVGSLWLTLFEAD